MHRGQNLRILLTAHSGNKGFELIKRPLNVSRLIAFRVIIITLFFIFIRACPLASLGVGARFQVRGHKPWGRKAAKRAYKLAFLPPRPQRLPPLRAFHLSASRNRKKRKKPVFILNFITTFGEKIIMKKLFDSAVSFRKKDFDKHKNLFVDLSHSQKPHTLFIGCSDSRLVPSLITSTIPGELFIIRSVANIIPPYKKGVNYPAISSAIEYAVLSLEVENIIVCGHSNCGGCGALYKTEEEMKHLPHTNLWLELSRPVKNRVMQMLPNATYAEREWMTEQMNVVQQINHLLTYPYVLERYNNNTLDIIGWYYVIEKGEIYNYEVEKGYFELINE